MWYAWPGSQGRACDICMPLWWCPGDPKPIPSSVEFCGDNCCRVKFGCRYVYGWLAGGESVCGPDITRPLKNTVIDVELTFQRWDPMTQMIRCDIGPNGYIWLAGWDIGWLNGGALSPYTILGEGVTCSAGDCARTVSVDGKCFHDWAVNYILFGEITRLCYGSGVLPLDAAALLAAHGFVFLFNTVMSWLPEYQLVDVAEKLPWATAGFAGWPYAASPGQPTSTAGCRKCPLPYVYGVNPRVFDWQWAGYYSDPVF